MIRRRFGFFCGALAVACFGKDVYQPVKRGALELGTGIGYAQSFGIYNADGNYESLQKLGFPEGYSPAAYGIPFKAKVGLGDGFDARAEWDAVFTNKDAGNLQGMGQPTIGIKYARPWGGFYSNLAFPYATGDLDKGNLSTVLEVGGLVRKKVHHFRFTGLLSYINVYGGSDVGRVSAQPEILWRRGMSTYFNVDFLKAVNKNAYVVSLAPGIRADITNAVFCDIGAGITAIGRNSPAAWSLKTNLYWTLFR